MAYTISDSIERALDGLGKARAAFVVTLVQHFPVRHIRIFRQNKFHHTILVLLINTRNQEKQRPQENI